MNTLKNTKNNIERAKGKRKLLEMGSRHRIAISLSEQKKTALAFN